MDVSSFARFKGGFDAPRVEDGPEGLERILEPPCTYLARGLAAAGIRCSDPEWCDYGYEIECDIGERRYCLSLSFDYDRWEWFEVFYSPNLGFFSRWFGRSESSEMAELSNAVDRVLRQRQGINDLRWYKKPLGNPEKGYTLHPESVGS